MAMEAIRRITPESAPHSDRGSRPGVQYAAACLSGDYENERRWLSFDLLMGRVGRHHPWYDIMVANGVAECDLDRLSEHPFSPDIIGINHYLTSDRYLDEDLARYPACFHGGNGTSCLCRHGCGAGSGCYSRSRLRSPAREASARYGRPLALTEVHNGSTRDESCDGSTRHGGERSVRGKDGVDIRAFTVWALAGGIDWPSSSPNAKASMKPGVLDIALRLRGGRHSRGPCASSRFPVSSPIRWRVRPAGGSARTRFHREPTLHPEPIAASGQGSFAAAPILIAGAGGTLARVLARACDARGLSYRALLRSEMDIADLDRVRAIVSELKPWAIINAAGYVRPSDAERERPKCMRENIEGAAVLAEIAACEALPFVTFSSDLVLDGDRGYPYGESHTPAPRCVYGESKAIAELMVTNAHPKALIVRTAAFFGPPIQPTSRMVFSND